MQQQEPFSFTPGVVAYPLAFVLVIWIIFWFEIRFGYSFNHYGIQPRSTTGLRGILFSPFIHGDLKHLFNNSVPLFVLSMALFYFYRSISWRILGYGLLLTGLLTWFLGRPAFHIGASGMIYCLVAFLFFKGVLSKHYRLVALSLIVVFLYGGLLWYVTPVDPEISWEGHLSGLIVGLLFALIYRKNIARPPIYAWEEDSYKEENDPFMQHFDEDGNFIERQEWSEDELPSGKKEG